MFAFACSKVFPPWLLALSEQSCQCFIRQSVEASEHAVVLHLLFDYLFFSGPRVSAASFRLACGSSDLVAPHLARFWCVSLGSALLVR